jgi:hypothetical protein
MTYTDLFRIKSADDQGTEVPAIQAAEIFEAMRDAESRYHLLGKAPIESSNPSETIVYIRKEAGPTVEMYRAIKEAK